jgi:hypothetical protein
MRLQFEPDGFGGNVRARITSSVFLCKGSKRAQKHGFIFFTAAAWNANRGRKFAAEPESFGWIFKKKYSRRSRLNAKYLSGIPNRKNFIYKYFF